jgi:hypothetical protein
VNAIDAGLNGAKSILSDLRNFTRERLLRLAGLPRSARALATLCLLSIAVLVSVILVAGPAATDLHQQRHTSSWPATVFGTDPLVVGGHSLRLLWLPAYFGLIIAAAVIAAARLSKGWPFPRLTLLVIALSGASFSALMRINGDEAAQIKDQYPYLWSGDVTAGVAAFRIAAMVGLLAMGCLIVASVWSRFAIPAVHAFLAATPYLAGLMAYILGSAKHLTVVSNPEVSSELSLRSYVLDALMNSSLQAAALFVTGLLLWGVVESARAATDSALIFKRLGAMGLRVAIGLLALKILWVGAGITGILPDSLGGSFAVWSHSRNDGFLSWGLALAFAGVLLAWWRVGPKPSDRHVRQAAVIVIAALVAGSIFSLLCDWSGNILRSFSILPPLQQALADTSEWRMRHELLFIVVPIFVLVGVGIVMLRRSVKNRMLAICLLTVAVWALPRAVSVTVNYVGNKEARSSIEASGDAFLIERDLSQLPERPHGPASTGGVRFPTEHEQYPGFVDTVTFDVALTCLVAIAALVAWCRSKRLPAWPLLLLVVATTVTAYFSEFVPDPFRRGQLYYVGLVFPVVYLILLDSASLNRESPARALRVLAALAIGLVSLSLLPVALTTGYTAPGQVSFTDVGLGLLKVPFLALLCLAALSAMRSDTREGQSREGDRRGERGTQWQMSNQ